MYQLVHDGPTMQRDLSQLLRIERATSSEVVATLVRKGLVTQVPDAADKRQRILSIAVAGRKLWDDLPDPIALTRSVAFDGADEAELAVARRMLRAGTQRLLERLTEPRPRT